MVFILVALVGLIAARWMHWFSVVAIALVLAVSVGVEGAIHSRTFLKVLQRYFEVNGTFQAAYLSEVLIELYGPRFLAWFGK